MDKIVIAVDSFKRCLPAPRVAEVVASAIRDFMPECKLTILPVSDGGEGLTDVLVNAMGGMYHTVVAKDPLMRDVKCRIGSFNHCAIIETASAIGLERLTPAECNPMKTSSYGLGMMINAAYDLGYRKMLVGLGGTATVDAGLGAMQALGVRFYNELGRIIPDGITGEDIIKVEHFDTISSKRKFRDVEFSIACDVTNPISGNRGAANVYAPQKGATPEQVQTLDFNIRHVCHVLRRAGFTSFENVQGSGAAGGLGMAFQTLMGCQLSSGINAVLDLVNFNDELVDADLVITGEGRVDSQSLQGKVLSGISRRTIEAKVPLLVIGGRIADKESLSRQGIKDTLPVSPASMPDEEAVLPDVAMKNIYDAITAWLEKRTKNTKS